MMHEAPLLRRRSYELILESAKASVASQCRVSNAPSCGEGDGKRGHVLRSSTARAVLAVASGVLLLLSLATDGIARDREDLSDSVTDLTQQLQHNDLKGEQALRDEITTETLELERQLEEKDIELAWEKQHVANQIESQHMMADKMKEQITKERGALTEMDHLLKLVAKDSDTRQHAIEDELSQERRENRRLHKSLDVALKQLAEARAQQAKPPPGSQVEEAGGEAKPSERQLRGVPTNQYQPGDNIEIIEHRVDGEVVLHPGIVSNVNVDGTYNLVKLESGTSLLKQRRDQFQTYRVYPVGAKAVYQIARNKFLPVTIVAFLPGPSRPGFDLHGSYKFTFDTDPNQEVAECAAPKIHRLAGLGERTRARSGLGRM